MPRSNAFWFAIAFVFGSLLVWFAKDADSHMLAAGIAVSVVALLTFYYIRSNQNTREEQADNVYYLGLLFTLLSLAYALWDIFGDGDSKDDINELLRNFGIALGSTIAGIVCRILILNWPRPGATTNSESAISAEDARDPLRAGGQAQEELSDLDAESMLQLVANEKLKKFYYLVNELIREFNLSVNALSWFHRTVRNHANDAEEFLKDYSKSLKQESDKFESRLQSSAEAFTEELKEKANITLKEVGDSFEFVSAQAKVLLEKLGSAHEDHLTKVRATTRSFVDEVQSKSNDELDTILRQLGIAATRTHSLVQNVSALHDQMNGLLNELASHSSNLGSAGAVLESNANKAGKSFDRLSVDIGTFQTALHEIHTGATTLTGTLNSMREQQDQIKKVMNVEQTTTAVQQINETLRSIADEGANATKFVRDGVDLFEAFAASARGLNEETRRAIEALQSFADVATKQTEMFQNEKHSKLLFWRHNHE